jgi:hypothetical protein
MKKPKPHILISESGVSPEGKGVAALCGALIEKAGVCFFWDEQNMGQPVAIPFVCRECTVKCYLSSLPEHCYIYAVVEKVQAEIQGEPI